jgi:prolyl-tRNA editing enzyme YbaK/EbsC (Cys-tRNA(Pro) deacylase)
MPSPSDPSGDPDRARLEAALAGRGAYELFACDPALADTAAFCAAYGFAPEDAANTIIVIGKSVPPRFAACVVLATHRLDVNRAVRDRLGTRRASFASPEDTRALTGQEIGGVTAFGLPEGLPLLVDAAVMRRERIVLGGGSRSWKVIAPPSILLTIPGVQVVEGLARPAEPQPEPEAGEPQRVDAPAADASGAEAQARGPAPVGAPEAKGDPGPGA